jgi:hypothetical protein
VQVLETGSDEAARLLARAHAAVVSDFVKYGHQEAMKAHEVPKASTAALAAPQKAPTPQQSARRD